jgi:uncharacterized membrane protein
MLKTARSFFTAEQRDTIKQAIIDAESNTSGEIRVHIETWCHGKVLDRAAKVFHSLKMQDTEQRNGVLIYLGIRHHKFAIIGDAGIHAQVGDNFWDDVKQKMVENFKDKNFTEGLVQAIAEVGTKLKAYFPHLPDDVNELPDDISFGPF